MTGTKEKRDREKDRQIYARRTVKSEKEKSERKKINVTHKNYFIILISQDVRRGKLLTSTDLD